MKDFFEKLKDADFPLFRRLRSLTIEETKVLITLSSRWGFYGAVIAISGKLLWDLGWLLNANLLDGRSHVSVLREITSEFGIIISSFLSSFLASMGKSGKIIQERPFNFLLLSVFIIAVWRTNHFPRGFYFTLFFLGIWALSKLPASIENDNHLHILAFTIAGIIATSIVIIFSFSAFILQATTKLLSPEYSTLLAKESKDKNFFWALALLSVMSCLAPFVLEPEKIPSSLLILLWIAFYFVFEMYEELKSNLALGDVLYKIKNVIFHEMKNQFKKAAKSPEAGKKSPNDEVVRKRFDEGIKHAKDLQEIALTFSAKDETRNCKLTLICVQDIYKNLLVLERDCFNKNKRGVEDSVYFLFMITISKNLVSAGEYLFRERKKSNVYSLLEVYNVIAWEILVNADEHEESISFIVFFTKYSEFVNSLVISKKTDWGAEAIAKFNRLFVRVLKREVKHQHALLSPVLFSYEMDKITGLVISKDFPDKFQENCLMSLINSGFEQIKASWAKRINVVWEDIFERWGKCISLPLSSAADLSYVDGLFSNFHTWQQRTLSLILNPKQKETQKGTLSHFVPLLKELGIAFNDFSLNHNANKGQGTLIIHTPKSQELNTKQEGLIIKSIGINLDLMRQIKQGHKDVEGIDKIYQTHIDVLVSHSNTNRPGLNLEKANSVLKSLLEAIKCGLEYGFDLNPLINQYIDLEEKRFNNMPDNRDDILESLDALSVLMQQHEKLAQEKTILSRRDKLKNTPH